MRTTLEESAALLNRGEVVAIPTETVWGLAASLKHPEAIERIFTLKGRPRQNPLIIHLADLSELDQWTEELPVDFDKLKTLWPGPLTLVLQANQNKIPETVRASLPTAAFRIPLHPQARELLKLTGPLVIPSANLSGRPSSTQASHVEADFGQDFPVMEGETSQIGLESTILSFHPPKWRILRQGALSPESFIPLLGYAPEIALPTSEKPECPGQLFRHYAPKATLIFAGDAEAIIGFQERSYALPTLFLGSLASPESAAHNLYDLLREIDNQGLKTVRLDMDFPTTGLWQTLRERLLKAAQPKP